MARHRQAWVGSRYQGRHPDGWQRVRMQVLRRDKFRCQHRELTSNGDQQCPNRATDVDHIGDPENHSLDNLQALCAPHHQKKSSSAGGRASAMAVNQRIAALRRPKPLHPGLRTPEDFDAP